MAQKKWDLDAMSTCSIEIRNEAKNLNRVLDELEKLIGSLDDVYETELADDILAKYKDFESKARLYADGLNGYSDYLEADVEILKAVEKKLSAAAENVAKEVALTAEDMVQTVTDSLKDVWR